MLLYLYGPDSYRRHKSLTKILTEYRKKHSDLSYFNFDLETDGAYDQFTEFCASQSLFAKTKLAVLRGATSGPDELPKFLKRFLEDKSTTIVVVAEKKLVKAFDFLLKEPVRHWEFGLLDGTALTAFIKKEAGELAIPVSAEVVDGLVATYGDNVWGIMTELEKLSLGASLEATSWSPNFFGMIQTVKNQNQTIGRRLSALDWLIDKNEPAAAFNILASQISGSEKIKMADYDVAVKSGKLEYPEVLLDFVLA